MIRFAAIAFIGLLLLIAGLRTIKQLTGGKRLFDVRSLKIALQMGSGEAMFALFVTIIGALIVAVSIFIFLGTLIILIFDPL
jgi:hypothetical protein